MNHASRPAGCQSRADLGILIARKPDVTFFRDEAEEKNADSRYSKPSRREYRQKVPYWMGYPDTPDLLARPVEGRANAKPDGVYDHAVEIPHAYPKRDICLDFTFIAGKEFRELIFRPRFQLGDEIGQLMH